MKTGEWRTVCDYYLEATLIYWVNFSYNLYPQGTALFMAGDLLNALTTMELERDAATMSEFAFQHRRCHDFESLSWVIVYAMMVHHRNTLAEQSPNKSGAYKASLDYCWEVHTGLRRCHNDMISTGCASY